MEISVLIKEPGKAPRQAGIENTLKSLQNAVGGPIETVTPDADAVIICNGEGRLLGLPHCCTVCGVDFVGTVVIAGVDGEDLADLPGGPKEWKRTFRSLWEAEK